VVLLSKGLKEANIFKRGISWSLSYDKKNSGLQYCIFCAIDNVLKGLSHGMIILSEGMTSSKYVLTKCTTYNFSVRYC